MPAGAVYRLELTGCFDHRRDVGPETPRRESVQDGVQYGRQALFTLISGLGISDATESFSVFGT